MVFSVWFSIRRLYNEYMERMSIIDSCDNLSKYEDKESHYRRMITKHRVFKESNFSVNAYYWRIKTKDSSYYYTTTDDEYHTLHNILRSTKISEFRSKCVDDFFEYCLISYVMNEKVELMEELSKGKFVKLSESGARVCTKEHFELNERNNNNNKDPRNGMTEVNDQFSSQNTPDLYIECDGESCIIGAYNGTSESEILRKLNEYSSSFPNSRVYVFSSGVSALEQISTKDMPTFSFYCIKDKSLNTVSSIKCGTVVLELATICEMYFSEYGIFKSEILYWLNCAQAGAIIRRIVDQNSNS